VEIATAAMAEEAQEEAMAGFGQER